MSAHTEGPWCVNGVFPDASKGHTFEPRVWVSAIYEGTAVRVADIPDVLDKDCEEMSNARLIAAAPDMAAALADLVRQVTRYINDDSCDLPDSTAARAALAKAGL